MTVLGIDTSAVSCGAAVAKDGKIISDSYVNVGLTHSRTLMTVIDSALKNAALTLNDIDILAVAAGPGSFTGIRIGVAAIKGMAFEKNIPVYGVSTLHALAAGVMRKNCVICPVMDARCSQVYTSLFEFDGENTNRITDDAPLKLDELEEILSKQQKTIVFVGDGIPVVKKYFAEKDINAEYFSSVYSYQHGSGVALLASMLYNNGVRPISADDLFPIYLRLSQAERERNQKQKGETQNDSNRQ